VADKKVTGMGANTTPAFTDLLHLINDPAGTPTNEKIELSDALGLAVTTFTSGEATPTVANGRVFKTAGTTAITDFDDGIVGQTIQILATASITVTDGAPIILNGSANYTMTDTDTLTLTMFNDQVWQEVGRSVN